MLFSALIQSRDEAERAHIRNLIATRYLGIARWLASRYAGGAVDIDELRAVGSVGLALAIDRFDPERGGSFVAFAKPTIQGEIRRYFRDKRRWIKLPRRLQETKALLNQAVEVLTHEFGRAPTVDEIAAQLGIDAERVLEAMTAEDNFTLASLDAPAGFQSDGDYTIADSVIHEETGFELLENCETLRPLVAALPEREQRMLHMRFFEDRSQSEIGAALGISQMQVSRVLTRTLATLRAQMLTDT